MNLEDYIEFIMSEKGRTLNMELRGYAKIKGKEKISKQGYSKQRQYINPEFFMYLNDAYVGRIYKTSVIKLYGDDYLLLGVDGSTNELPNSKELKEYYGLSKGQEKSVGRARARVEGVYDVLNEVMVKAKIRPYDISEKEMAIELVREVKEVIPEEKTIMIYDRYYFGVGFAYELNKMGQKYMMRIREEHYRKEREGIEKSKEVRIKIRTNSVYYSREEIKEELRRLKEIKVRIIKVELENGEEYIATNLSEEELPSEDAKEIYGKRWGIERAFDRIKNKLQVENYSSRKIIGIEQEFYAGILVYNMIEDLIKDAEEEKKRKGKYEYKINHNIAVGIYREEIIRIFGIEEEEERKKEYDRMVEEMSKYVVEVKDGRHYERRRMHSMNKYRHNLRRNS